MMIALAALYCVKDGMRGNWQKKNVCGTLKRTEYASRKVYYDSVILIADKKKLERKSFGLKRSL